MPASQDTSALVEQDSCSARRAEWEHALWQANLRGTTKLAGLALTVFVDRNGAGTYPGIDVITARCGLSMRTVRPALDVLLDAGWVRWRHRRADARHLVVGDTYRLTIPTRGRS